MKRSSARRPFRNDEQGATLVEFAFCAVVFFAIIFGTIEYGMAAWQHNMLSDLAQEGARWAAVRGSTACGSPVACASANDVKAFVVGRSVGLVVAANVTVPSAPSSLNPGDAVTVTVQKAFTPLTGLIPRTTMTLTSTAQMIMAR